ncbi:hypothetical protein [Desulfosarcina ovata]|nr:hypothetical protein [Desulfosarcina ovata]
MPPNTPSVWAYNTEYLTYVIPYSNATLGLDGAPQTFGATVNYRF